ncbi:hypothetical protein DRE_01482 [Drechslerella stenobrocha 248]|uniref:Cyclic nucleotide-binding domain-containing protein n=1 Tax=Drechslerella stenobrocha 248 TaxID=1043628 RepID=W7I4E4_9PEZI|nr:hypothetical protein DRE_01482 [Drechslerella stenobrocha 248]
MRRRGAPVAPTAGSSPLSILHTFDQEMNPARPVRPSPLTTHQSGMPLDLLERLRSFPLFQTAPEEFLAAIATHIRPQQHAPRDYILTEGDEAKAMYWLVRGAVAVTSRDGESTYFELRPGAFFGEIGILMDIPRTATIIARTRCLLVVLTKDALRRELPKFPDVEKSIREEAMERLAILEKKKREGASGGRLKVGIASSTGEPSAPLMGLSMRPPEAGSSSSFVVAAGVQRNTTSESVLATGELNIRQVLKELPLFANLPAEILHFLGMNATPISYPPFTPIVLQNSPGTEIFFIIQGEVEVVDHSAEISSAGDHTPSFSPESGRVVAKLRKGDHFGEVAGLGLTTKRMATVRTISSVECLVIEGNVLEELWRRWNTEMKREVEATARRRLSTADPADSDKMELDAISTGGSGRSTPTYSISRMDLADASAKLATHLKDTAHVDHPLKQSLAAPTSEQPESIFPGIKVIEPLDPDPFLPADFDSMRAKSRRGSLAPPPPPSTIQTGEADVERPISPSPNKSKHPATPPEHYTSAKRARIVQRRTTQFNKGALKDDILIKVFECMELHELMRLRQVSTHWAKILNTNRTIIRILDLKPYNRVITDDILASIIVPFVGSRPEVVDISNCYHLTDEGFTVLANVCAPNAKVWKMKSVWDITGQAVLDMSNKAKGLEEIDLSNCRKVSDTLLARVTGWVVPEMYPTYAQMQQFQNDPAKAKQHEMLYPPAGTVIGCPKLKRMTLSYCKHVTDRTMSHIAAHAAARLERVDLSRCTTITDLGFQHWSVSKFPNLTHLCLADCTYLTDSAIVFLTNAAKELKVLDLSFCCALSDTATEVLSLGCQSLVSLKLSFCGSAVSDSSLRAISLHLLELRELSVRGCVRVTGVGVEAVVEGCTKLESFDVSQCKNLTRWLDGGGVERCQKMWKRKIRFDTVARNTAAGDRMR